MKTSSSKKSYILKIKYNYRAKVWSNGFEPSKISNFNGNDYEQWLRPRNKDYDLIREFRSHIQTLQSGVLKRIG